jgi:hypothetical protein
MSKKTIAILYVLFIAMALVGGGLVLAGLAGSTYTNVTNGYSTSYQMQSLGNPPLFVTGVILASLSGIPHLIAWIGALINLGRLQQWVWFVLMLLFSTICLLVYLIAGPQAPRVAQQYAPRQDMPPQPPQYRT